MIINLIKYYRGNKFVIRAIEKLFKIRGINIRKNYLLEILNPKDFEELKEKYPEEKDLNEKIDHNYSLYELFKHFGELQDNIRKSYKPEDNSKENFTSFDNYLKKEKEKIEKDYKNATKTVSHKNYFYNSLYPKVFACIKASILEYQMEYLEVIETI